MSVDKTIWHLVREIHKGNAIWGRLYNKDNGLTFWTIENASTLIPEGFHPCKKDYYHRGDYETFEILKQPLTSLWKPLKGKTRS